MVKLLEPVIKNNPNIRLNKLNNIEFDCKIASGKTEELVIKNTIEHLADQEIDLKPLATLKSKSSKNKHFCQYLILAEN